MCEGSIATACFVQENMSYLVGSGSAEGEPNDNSLTLLTVSFTRDRRHSSSDLPTFKYKVRVKKAHGDKFGVMAVAGDNSRKQPIIFSAGGSDDPWVKIWNFETKELILNISSKDEFSHIQLNLIVVRQSPAGKLAITQTSAGRTSEEPGRPARKMLHPTRDLETTGNGRRRPAGSPLRTLSSSA